MKINYDDVGAGGVGTTGGVVVVVVVGAVVDVVVGAVDVVVGAVDVVDAVTFEAVGTTGGAGAGVSCFFCNAF